MLDKELFVFVTKPKVDGTNKAAERDFVDDALARKNNLTSKTPNGESDAASLAVPCKVLAKILVRLMLSAVAEVQRWLEIGESSFTAQVQQLNASMQYS